MPDWPQWWLWELEFSPHALKRMIDRGFNEVDLRLMLEQATGYHSSSEPGRWVVATRFRGRAWEVILESLNDEHLLLVITAYSVEP